MGLARGRNLRLRRIGPLGRLVLGLPRIVATCVKVQSHGLTVQLRFDFVFDVGGGYEDAAVIAWSAAALAAPHPNGCRPPECRYREAPGAWFGHGHRAIGGS